MDIKELGENLISMVTENKEILENTWESVPPDMQIKIKEELEKAKQQMIDYENSKKEQHN